MKKKALLSLLFASSFISVNAQTKVFQAFEGDGYGDWNIEGEAFGLAPTAGGRGELANKISNYAEESFAESNALGLEGKGVLTSPKFTFSLPHLTFLLGGTKDAEKIKVQLFVEGELVEEVTANNNNNLERTIISVREYKGKSAHLKIIDNSEKGYILVDHISFVSNPNARFPRPTKNGVVYNVGMKASKALPQIQIPDDSELKIFATAKKHGMRSPTAICIDEKGSVFIAETWRFKADHGIDDNRRRLHWLKEDLALQTTSDRKKMYERWYHKHPEEIYTTYADKVRVMTDTNGDGLADKSSLFADGFNDHLDGPASGVMAYNGTVYLASIPHIWALKDKDGDGSVSKAERISVQEGFGVRVSFSGHDLNGFAFGPDGRIYTTVGDRGFNITTKEGKTFTYPGQGAILRFNPDGSDLEVVHTGLRNPKEIAFDQWGNGISVDNNSDQGDQARVVYMMEGGDSGWRMGHQVLHSFHRTVGIEERPINRWMQEEMWKPRNESQPAYMLPPLLNFTSGPSGLTYDPGTSSFRDFKNSFLICDFRGTNTHSGISAFKLREKGASLEVHSARKFNWGVAATDLDYGYDGRIYVADWIGGWMTQEAGQVYTIATTDKAKQAEHDKVAALMKSGVENQAKEKLFELLGHADQRVRLRAQFALVDLAEKEKEVLGLLVEFAKDGKLDILKRLHAVWGLGMMARLQDSEEATQMLVLLLGDEHYRVRGQAAKVLGESSLKSGESLLPLLDDESPRVRAFAALSLARLKVSTNKEIIAQIEANNNKDAYLRHALVMALHHNTEVSQLAALSSHSSAAVRLAAVLALRKHESPELVRFLSDKNEEVKFEAVRAIHDQQIQSVQGKVAEMIDDYTADGDKSMGLTKMHQRRLVHAAFRVGGIENAERLIKVAGHQQFHLDERLEALRLFTMWEEPPVVDRSIGKYSPLPKRAMGPVRKLLEEQLNSLLDSDPEIVSAALLMTTEMKLKPKGMDVESLQALVLNEKLASKVRASALGVLKIADTKGALALAEKLASDKDTVVAAAALETLVEGDVKKVSELILTATESSDQQLRQKAWKVLEKINTAAVNKHLESAVYQLTEGKGDKASAIEILELAEKRVDQAEVKKALAVYREKVKGDLLAEWSVSLQGGRIEAGQAIYKSHGGVQCMRCHKIGYGHKAGGEAGPNLAGIGNLGNKHILESLILPSAKIAPGFAFVNVDLNHSGTTSGTLMEEKKTHIVLKTGDDLWKIQRSDIKSISKPVSSMPVMHTLLNKEQMRDLLAYLSSEKAQRRTTKLKGVKPFDIEAAKKAAESGVKVEFDLKSSVAAGQKVYAQVCVACHGEKGAGLPAAQFPPLDKSEWLDKPNADLIKIQLRGLAGPIEVKGKIYNGIMPPNAMLNDGQIADVINYIRSQWSSSKKVVKPEDVKALRSEVGKPMLKAKDF